MLGWVVILLHSQIQQLSQKLTDGNSNSNSIIVSNKFTLNSFLLVTSGYNEETILGLQRTVRELGLNQTSYHLTIQNYSRMMEEFQKHTSSIILDVNTIKDSLKEAPQMLNIGKELDSLKNRIATYEATVSDLKLSLKDLKDTSASLETIKYINSTIGTSIESTVKDLHTHHVRLSYILI